MRIKSAASEYSNAISSKVNREDVRQEILNSFREFQKSFRAGFQLVASSSTLKTVDDTEKMLEAVRNQKPLFELLGLSWEEVQNCYKAARKLMQEKRYSEAKDAFFFLTACAATCDECWLGLAIASLHCGAFDDAVIACRTAIKLRPDKAANYLGFSFVLMQMRDVEGALRVLALGHQYATSHKSEAWAKELSCMMEEGKREIAKRGIQ